MKLSTRSLILFGISVIILFGITLFDSLFSNLSPTLERIILFLLLVLPSAVGTAFGIMSLIRKEPGPWLGVLGSFLNGMFALFHLFLLSFAG